jgi:hypothetical protein
VQLLWKAVWRFLKKLNTELPYNPAIPLLGVLPKKCKSGYNRHLHTMFIAASFTIDSPWRQSRCPTTDEWIKKMLYIYTMEYYSVIRNNEIIAFAGKWMELEIFLIVETFFFI